jgi:hypothetical protein
LASSLDKITQAAIWAGVDRRIVATKLEDNAEQLRLADAMSRPVL